MASTTSNIGLTKPAGTEKALVSVINNNSDIIDSAAGGLMDAIAIVANGNTHAAISAGQYVYVHNHGTLAEGLYTANSAIAANATLSTSNLTADASGGLNALNSNINKVARITTVGDFASKATLDGYLNTLLTGMENDEVRSFKSACSAAFGVFVNGITYAGTIYKSGANTTYSHVELRAIGRSAVIEGYKTNDGWSYEELALNSSIFISGTIGSRLALLDTTGDSYTIPATGMYKLSFAGTGGQIKMNGSVLFDNNVAVQFAVPFKQGASLSWTKAGGTCSIYRVE